MNETNPVIEVAPIAPAPKAAKPAKASKDKTAPKAQKKAATPKEKATAKDRSMSKVPAADRRQAFLKLLRKHKADKATSAMTISKIAEKLGYGTYDVYCLGYHKFPLATGGYVKSVKMEGDKELSFHLTAKGVKSGPDDAE